MLADSPANVIAIAIAIDDGNAALTSMVLRSPEYRAGIRIAAKRIAEMHNFSTTTRFAADFSPRQLVAADLHSCAFRRNCLPMHDSPRNSRLHHDSPQNYRFLDDFPQNYLQLPDYPRRSVIPPDAEHFFRAAAVAAFVAAAVAGAGAAVVAAAAAEIAVASAIVDGELGRASVRPHWWTGPVSTRSRRREPEIQS